MNHEQEEEELEALLKTKCATKIRTVADECFWDEDYHDGIDNIHLGLRGTGKKTWDVTYEELIFIFIGEKFEDVKERIISLPNILTAAQRHDIIVKLEATIPGCRLVEFDDPNANTCRFVVDSDPDKWGGRVVDGVKLRACIDPKRYIKVPKKKKGKK